MERHHWEYPQDTPLHALFEAQVERMPNAVAVVCGGEQLTYSALNQRANQLAHYLRSLDMGPEVCVGLCVERSLEMVVGLLGILKAGGSMYRLTQHIPPSVLLPCSPVPSSGAGGAAAMPGCAACAGDTCGLPGYGLGQIAQRRRKQTLTVGRYQRIWRM